MTVIMKDVTDYRIDISYQPLENIIIITFTVILANCDEWGIENNLHWYLD